MEHFFDVEIIRLNKLVLKVHLWIIPIFYIDRIMYFIFRDNVWVLRKLMVFRRSRNLELESTLSVKKFQINLWSCKYFGNPSCNLWKVECHTPSKFNTPQSKKFKLISKQKSRFNLAQ